MFHKYPDIENAYQQGFLDKIKEAGYWDIPYAVTEKIHGSNSQVSYSLTDKTFRFGTRNNPLEDDQDHYNLKKCVKPLEQNLSLLAEALAKDLASYGQRILSVTFFGEICGGVYPHPDVALNKSATKVQKGVYYSPSNQWLAFDISYEAAGSEQPCFLPAIRFIRYCGTYKIPTVPLIAIVDGLDYALTTPNDGKSRVSERYHLPEIEDNIMEGVVIRPAEQDIRLGYNRLILKNKNEKFKEKWKAKKLQTPEEIPEKVKQAMEEISQYITLNRVHNVLSHEPEASPKDIGKFIMLVSKDVLEDYRKDYTTLDALEKKEEKAVTKYMNDEIAKLVRDAILYGK